MTIEKLIAKLEDIEPTLSLVTNGNKEAAKAYQRIIDICAEAANKLRIISE